MVLVLCVAACGKSASKSEVEACDRMAKLCGEDFTAAERRECIDGWPEFRKSFGEDTANKFSSCTREAKSCPEVLGCATGLIGTMGKDFEKGLDKMMGDHKSGGGTSDTRPPDAVRPPDVIRPPDVVHVDNGEEPLPAECKRADEVCDKDEPFARDKCRRMVGNLKADAANLTELTTCYAAANNCFAFKKCTTDMWFKLN